MSGNFSHTCPTMDSDIRIVAKVHQINRDRKPKTIREYWVMEWAHQDSNDPCYGTLEIKYCPYCGRKLT